MCGGNLSEEDYFDWMETIEPFMGCIGQTPDKRIGLYECKDCTPMQRVNCPRPKQPEKVREYQDARTQ